jgi:hypothetical protein
MTNSVLYYPYNRVPDNDWFTRVLLYWDTVGSIVPHEHIGSPEKLGPHMHSLPTEGLMKQITPGSLTYKTSSLTEVLVHRAPLALTLKSGHANYINQILKKR